MAHVGAGYDPPMMALATAGGHAAEFFFVLLAPEISLVIFILIWERNVSQRTNTLLADLERLGATHLSNRRSFLQALAGTGLLVSCGSSAKTSAESSTTGGTSTTTSGTGGVGVSKCETIPEETAGPYPGDGSNGAGGGGPGGSGSSSGSTINALQLSGIVRSDIRSSFAGVSGTADGVGLVVKLTLVSKSSGCLTPASRAVYLWHCNRVGNYSLYGQADQNYLRGVQATDGNGVVSFTTIYPACYSGRWPHIHFEVYPSVAQATSYTTKSNTSQIAMPADICNTVFAVSGYEASVQNFKNTSLSTDNVFSDGAELETPTITGNVADGFVLALTVAV